MRLPSLAHVFFFSVLCGHVLAALKQKQMRVEQIKWNSSYYTDHFHVCKTLRVLNAVEKMKAKKAAVEVFRQCGSKLLTLAAFKYKFPSFAISKTLKYFCFLYNYMFAYIANDGGLVISPETESALIMAMSMRFAAIAKIPGNIVLVKHGRGEYALPQGLVEEGATWFFRCSLPNKLTNWVDGDIAKYCVSHHESMLL